LEAAEEYCFGDQISFPEYGMYQCIAYWREKHKRKKEKGEE
jgi:hypothetical protein